MARRRELKNIAGGIADSFNSRNNDVDGYWGVGKLYKHVYSTPEKTVSMELVGHSIIPRTSEFDSLLEFYYEKLLRHLKKRDIPATWVKSVSICARFEAEYQPQHHFWRSALGKPCVIVVDIVDDRGRHHMATVYNNCRPHDPEREVRSARISNV